MTAMRRLLCAGLLAFNLALLTGCLAAATPMIKRERGPSGKQLEKNSFDPTTVQVGVSQRTEILTKFKMIDTGIDSPNLFWGRWASSKWGYVFAVGGYGAAAGDAGRIWGIHNLLVTFDENGVAESMQIVEDGKPFWQELRKHAGKLPPIELSEPIVIDYDFYGPHTIRFGDGTVEVTRDRGKISKANFPPQNVVRLSHTYADDERNNPASSCHVLHLSEKTPVGKNIRFCADPPELLAIFRYFHRYSPGMQWE